MRTKEERALNRKVDQLLQEYADLFGEQFPLMQYQTTLERISIKLQECIASNIRFTNTNPDKLD